MIPTIFDWLSLSTELAALIPHDDLELAIFRDEAPQDYEGDYLVWRIVAGAPHNCMDDVPPADAVRVQFDAYADDQDDVDAIYVAARDELEAGMRGHVISFNGTDRDIETRKYRVSWDMSFHVGRASASSTDALLTPGGTPILLPGGGSLRLP